MNRASGGSLWHIDDAESNAHDAIEVDAGGVAWRIRPMGGETESTVRGEHPEARRFMSRVLREKRRLAQRSLVRPVPKPARRRQRVRVRELVECPACTGADFACGCCGGDGWVSLEAAERWAR